MKRLCGIGFHCVVLLAGAAAGPAPVTGRQAALEHELRIVHPPAMPDAAVGGAVPLTLAEAVRAARLAHPSLAVAGWASASAEAAVREAGAARLPMLALDGTLNRFQEPMVVAPLHGFDPRLPPRFDRTLIQSGISASYTVYDGGARGSRIRRAEALWQRADLGATAAEHALLAEVSRAYLQVGSAREVLAAHKARETAVTAELARATRIFEEGRGARVMVLRAEAALGAATAERELARAELDVAERELALLMGAAPGAVADRSIPALRLAAHAAVPDPALLVASALASNPELAGRRHHVAAAEQTLREARSLSLPRIQLGARLAHYGSGGSGHQAEWQGGLQLSYPLFTAGSRDAAQERAAAGLGAARSELDLAELRLVQALDRAGAALASASARTMALAAALASAAEVARIEGLALDAGAGLQTDYLAAEAELLRVRSALTAARIAELLARVELARLAGDLSEDWLARNLEPDS